ncbi:hypothetical protein B0H65DRAFT_422330, partial [Neurospora tetraspora]
NDCDDIFFGEEGGDSDGERGFGSLNSDFEKEEDTVIKLKLEKKVAISNKRKLIDLIIKDNVYKAVRFNKERYNNCYLNKERSYGKFIILRKKSLYYIYY